MATQRYISTSFWDDEWVQTLDPSEKLLYLYYMTNPLTNIAGVYKITIRRISFDTGLNIDTIGHIMAKFEKARKVFRIGEYIALPNWPKHQKWQVSTKIRDGIISCLQEVPKGLLIDLVNIGYQFDLSVVDGTAIAYKQRKDISGSTVKKVYDKYGGSCAECGGTETLNIHHIKSVKDGGGNGFDNLVLLCAECHKKAHSPDTVSGLGAQSRYPLNYSDSDSDSDSEFDSEFDLERGAHKAPPSDNPEPEKPSDTSPPPKRFTKPTLEEVRAYCAERRNTVSPEKFLDYYEANGWRVGRNPMKDWRAAVRNWEQNEKAGGKHATRPSGRKDPWDEPGYYSADGVREARRV